MTLQQLVYAVKIADTKSMNKAAAELYVSQPALSSTIRDLEEELNIELFIRTNRGIVITAEGDEFLSYARQMVELNQMIEDRYINNEKKKNKFSVSMQHYSFAVEAFIELAKEIRLDDFELAVHETRTNEVIEFVRDYRSELGILYLNEFNRKALQKIFSENGLEFTELFDCDVFVYLSNEHPLAGKERLDRGIAKERLKLDFLKKRADYILDTSTLLTRELKAELERIFMGRERFSSLFVTILSFGFKYGIPSDADLVFDVRFLPNPYYDENLRSHTGNEKAVQDFVRRGGTADVFLDKLYDMIDFLFPYYVKEGKNQLVIAVGCTGGKHRSVTVANRLYERLKEHSEIGLKLEHRDIEMDNRTKG